MILLPVFARSPFVLLPRFEPPAFLQSIQRYKITIVVLVPPILVLLARHPSRQPHPHYDFPLISFSAVVDKFDLSTLRVLISGAAPLGAGLASLVHQRLLARSTTKKECVVAQGTGVVARVLAS